MEEAGKEDVDRYSLHNWIREAVSMSKLNILFNKSASRFISALNTSCNVLADVEEIFGEDDFVSPNWRRH